MTFNSSPKYSSLFFISAFVYEALTFVKVAVSQTKLTKLKFKHNKYIYSDSNDKQFNLVSAVTVWVPGPCGLRLDLCLLLGLVVLLQPSLGKRR